MPKGDELSERTSGDYLKAAFLAMETPSCFISLARQFGGGSMSPEVQLLILEHCINNMAKGITYNSAYVKNILKKVIVAAESAYEAVEDGLYEHYAYLMALPTEADLLKEREKIYKQISFLFPGSVEINSNLMDLVVPIQCSLNMLEGDTGCSLWPSSLFLSEFVLSYPHLFSKKFCFEVGSGVGLVGISLIHVGAPKVVLSDGDVSSLANLKYNLELNHLPSENNVSGRTYVECKHLQWEYPSRSNLQSYQPDIVLGADIIYDPVCVPHLVQVISILLGNERSSQCNPDASVMTNCVCFSHQREQQTSNISHSETREAPIAYIAQVIRNQETFNYFLKVAEEAHLCVVDITDTKRPLNLLPYMLSYDRSNVHLFRVSSLRNCTS